MPSFSSKVDLSASAKSSNIVLADVDLIKGAFKVYTSSDLNSTNVNYFSDGQIVYVSDSGSLYKANVTLANPGLGIFSDSVSFSEFSFDSGSFTSASFNSGDSTLSFFGPDLSGSAQVSMSVDLSDLSGGGGGATQDLQSVLTAGNKASGSVVLENDNSSGKLGLFFHADPSLSYDYTASISILNNGSLETGLGGTAHERITPNRGSTVLLQFTASNSVAFTGISNEEQSYVLGYDSVTGNVTYYDTSSFGGGSTDISDLNTFTGSAETRLDDLEAATGSYITNAQTGSFLVPSDTGSLLITGSVSSNVITLEKGDGTSFTLTVDTGSGGGASIGTLQQVTEQGNETTLPISIQKIKIQSGLGWNREDALSSSLFIGENIAPAAINVASQSSLAQYELNTFIGGNAGQHVTEFLRANTVIGTEAALGESGIPNNLGASNTIIGAQAMYTYQRGGGGNTVMGAGAFNNFKSGSDNIVIGRSAAYQANSGSHNIYIGVNTGPLNGKLAENEIVIGTDPDLVNSGGLRGHGSNTVTLGNTSTTDNYFTGNLTGSINDVYIAGWGSISASLASLEAGGGSGDITSVVAGNGISGGASSGDATLTLDTGSAHFIAGVLKSGLFRLTGSVYSTANDVAITGSLDVNFVESTQEFRVSSQSVTQFSINNEGVAVLAPRSTVPTAVSGGMYFSTDGNFYFGIQQ